MDIHEATKRYELWLGRETRVVATELRDKHAQMRDDLYGFLRGAFYRWAQLCPVVVPEAWEAPHLIAIGDLHLDSFGTWRDAEGRMAWGVDDFDNAYPLPYTNDLIRLAASARIARDAGLIDLKPRQAAETILDGYVSSLRAGGHPMVFAEAHQHLETLGIDVIKPPRQFWRKLEALPKASSVPRSAERALHEYLPDAIDRGKVVRREAGLGSLGQPRFVLVAQCDGGAIAREVKALIPSDCVWAYGRRNRQQPYYARAMAHAVRSPDPFQRIVGKWIVRRLSPDSNPIQMANLPGKRDELRLLSAMGAEAANVHLGNRTRVRAVLADVRRRKSGWLRAAAKRMAKALEREWQDFR